LYDKNALHHDPWTGKPVTTRIWASGVMQSAKGGWSDLTSKAGREWWAKGVESLIDYGMDGMWK
jgi:alpha-glucosidase (family GH31 glycosyl hydrolase)